MTALTTRDVQVEDEQEDVGCALLLALQFGNALDVERYRLQARNVESPARCWVNVAIVGIVLCAVVLLAALPERLPRRDGAQALMAKTVLGFTVLVVVWASAVATLLPLTVLTSALFEHAALI